MYIIIKIGIVFIINNIIFIFLIVFHIYIYKSGPDFLALFFPTTYLIQECQPSVTALLPRVFKSGNRTIFECHVVDETSEKQIETCTKRKLIITRIQEIKKIKYIYLEK